MTNFIINPGTGPCKNATEENAIINMNKFIEDLEIKKEKVEFSRIPEYDYNTEHHDGRFAFILNIGADHSYEIQMPGISLENVRFLRKPDQNIWDYPRMYVDGSSWVWYYALSIITGRQ